MKMAVSYYSHVKIEGRGKGTCLLRSSDLNTRDGGTTTNERWFFLVTLTAGQPSGYGSK